MSTPTHDDYPLVLDPTAFPPAPWRLRGTLHLSLWRVPLASLPDVTPPGVGIVSVAGQALAVTAWAAYEPGGALSYNELLFVTSVRKTGLAGPAGTVGPIWVDDEAAAQGGRALWGIPKRLGSFGAPPAASPALSGMVPTATRLHQDGRLVASLEFEPRQRFAVPLHSTIWTVQQGATGLLRTRCRLRGRLRFGAAQWEFAPDGALGFLHGRTPLASARMEMLSAEFGI
ncbi:acetoacetate decarboxylase family protein [Bordetella genomosp. 13]|uniref:acetoacetate decarboxylase family protein n=1 Tax=Bordetella genomosp. 13 TaxID=463040 RepID=UPI00119E71D5|nr:acetoacetate decarboxylase family protein [Bordetella genomosp. 13]